MEPVEVKMEVKGNKIQRRGEEVEGETIEVEIKMEVEKEGDAKRQPE